MISIIYCNTEKRVLAAGNLLSTAYCDKCNVAGIVINDINEQNHSGNGSFNTADNTIETHIL